MYDYGYLYGIFLLCMVNFFEIKLVYGLCIVDIFLIKVNVLNVYVLFFIIECGLCIVIFFNLY